MRVPARTPTTQLVLIAAMLFPALGASAATALDTDSEIESLFSESKIPGNLDVISGPTVMPYRYVEATFPEALSHLAQTTGGVMDNVYALRDTYAADEVVLLIEDYTACGIDWPRLPYWSNPDMDLDGDPIGVPEGTSTNCNLGEFDPSCDADNRKTLNATAPTVASFRRSIQLPSAPVDLLATAVSPTRIDLSWTDTCKQERGFRIERSPDGVSGWALIGSVVSNVTFYSDMDVIPEATYYYRVQAYNHMGTSDYSNVAAAMTPTNIVGPLVYEDQVVDDDRAGTSDGNRSGFVDCGETIELKVSLANQGYAEVTGVVAELGVADPYVTWTGNMLSSYPIIEGLASDLNREAFEFEVAQSTPNGHLIHFDLAVVADNWGPGTIEFDVPVFCSANAEYRIYLPIVFH